MDYLISILWIIDQETNLPTCHPCAWYVILKWPFPGYPVVWQFAQQINPTDEKWDMNWTRTTKVYQVLVYDLFLLLLIHTSLTYNPKIPQRRYPQRTNSVSRQIEFNHDLNNQKVSYIDMFMVEWSQSTGLNISEGPAGLGSNPKGFAK